MELNNSPSSIPVPIMSLPGSIAPTHPVASDPTSLVKFLEVLFPDPDEIISTVMFPGKSVNLPLCPPEEASAEEWRSYEQCCAPIQVWLRQRRIESLISRKEGLKVGCFTGKDGKVKQQCYSRSITRRELCQQIGGWAELNQYNQDGWRIYLRPNSRTQTALSPNTQRERAVKDADIIRLNVVFAEMDDRSIAEQHALYDTATLPPSARIETGGKSVHAYWFIYDVETAMAPDCDAKTATIWNQAQKGLIQHFNSDCRIKNTSRMMALPGFNYVKLDLATLSIQSNPTHIHRLDSSSRYTLEEIQDAFPYVAKQPVPPASSNVWTALTPASPLPAISAWCPEIELPATSVPGQRRPFINLMDAVFVPDIDRQVTAWMETALKGVCTELATKGEDTGRNAYYFRQLLRLLEYVNYYPILRDTGWPARVRDELRAAAESSNTPGIDATEASAFGRLQQATPIPALVADRLLFQSTAEAHAAFCPMPAPRADTDATPLLPSIDPIGAASLEELEPWVLPAAWQGCQLAVFPLHVFPPLFQAMCTEIAEQIQVELTVTATQALAAVATLIMRCVDGVQVGKDFQEASSLSFLSLLRSGESKSPAMRAFFAVLELLEQEKVKSEARSKANLVTQRDCLQKRYTLLMGLSANAKGEGERLRFTQEAQGVKFDLTGLPEPADFCLILKNITAEGFTTALVEQPGGRISVIDSEPQTLKNLAGYYSNGKTNLDAALQTWSGDAVKETRAGGRRFAPYPRSVFNIMGQPERFKEITRNQELNDSGFLARFLYVFSESKVGAREWKPRIKSETQREYELFMRSLFSVMDWNDMREAQLLPSSFLLSEEARVYYWQYRNTIEKAMHDGGRFFGLEAWANKLAGQAVRLALVLHVLTVFSKLPETARLNPEQVQTFFRSHTEISAATFHHAMEVADCYTTHALKVFGALESSPLLDAMQKIAKWVKTKGLKKFFKRDLLRAKLAKDSTEADQYIAELQTRGILEKVESAPRGRVECFVRQTES